MLGHFATFFFFFKAWFSHRKHLCNFNITNLILFIKSSVALSRWIWRLSRSFSQHSQHWLWTNPVQHSTGLLEQHLPAGTRPTRRLTRGFPCVYCNYLKAAWFKILENVINPSIVKEIWSCRFWVLLESDFITKLIWVIAGIWKLSSCVISLCKLLSLTFLTFSVPSPLTSFFSQQEGYQQSFKRGAAQGARGSSRGNAQAMRS